MHSCAAYEVENLIITIPLGFEENNVIFSIIPNFSHSLARSDSISSEKLGSLKSSGLNKPSNVVYSILIYIYIYSSIIRYNYMTII